VDKAGFGIGATFGQSMLDVFALWRFEILWGW